MFDILQLVHKPLDDIMFRYCCVYPSTLVDPRVCFVCRKSVLKMFLNFKLLGWKIAYFSGNFLLKMNGYAERSRDCPK